MRRDQASKDQLRALVGVDVEAQAEVSGTISGTNSENGQASSEIGGVAPVAKTVG